MRIHVYFTPICISDSWCCRKKPVAQFGSQLRKIEKRCFMVCIFKQNYGIYCILCITLKTVCAKTMFWKIFCQNTECRAIDSLIISSLHLLRELIQLPPLITAPPTNCGNPSSTPAASSSPEPPPTFHLHTILLHKIIQSILLCTQVRTKHGRFGTEIGSRWSLPHSYIYSYNITWFSRFYTLFQYLFLKWFARQDPYSI